MNPAARSLLSALVGLATAVATMLAVEAIGHAVRPAPAGVDLRDPAAAGAYIAQLPAAALLFVGTGWMLAILVGTWVAALIARSGSRRYALLTGAFVALGAVANFAMIPHPTWFIAAGALMILLATALAWRLPVSRPPRPAAGPPVSP